MKFFRNPKAIVGTLVLLMTLAIAQATFANTYIANSNTGKFHYSSCRWVGKMSESHKVYYSSREEAIDAGYVPCKVCHP